MSSAPAAQPGISIVIPVKGRLTELQRLFASLRSAVITASGIACECFVVWDGVDDPAGLAQTCLAQYIPVRCVYHEAGPSGKRNWGLENAQHECVLFIDSDCTIHPCLLVALAKRFADPAVHAIAVPVEFELGKTAIEHAAALMPYRRAFSWASAAQPLWWAPAATLALRKGTAAAHGGFRSIGGRRERAEDVDLGLRWTQALGRPAIQTLPECPSQHCRESWAGWPAQVERAWRFGSTEALLSPCHPAFRRTNLPSLLGLSLLAGLLVLALVLAGWPWGGAMVLLAAFFSLWAAQHLGQSRAAGAPAKIVLTALLLTAVYEVSLLVSRLAILRPVAGIWFHSSQPRMEWQALCRLGWTVAFCALLLLAWDALGWVLR